MIFDASLKARRHNAWIDLRDAPLRPSCYSAAYFGKPVSQ